MNMQQGVTALDSFRLSNRNNNLYSNKVSSSDFENMLNIAEKKVEKTSTFISAKQSLQDTYPDLKYHVMDASQFTYWNRLDFPDSKLFEENIDVEALKAWKPTKQTATGYEPWVQRDLEKIPKGLHAVFIHPTTQKNMDADPEYAKRIVNKIEKYFENDIKINEKIDPESIKGMSQAVTVTEDGEIGLHVTVCDGPSKTTSDSEEAAAKKGGKEQPPLSQLQNKSLSFPLGQITTATLEYDYRYIHAFNQRRKLEDPAR